MDKEAMKFELLKRDQNYHAALDDNPVFPGSVTVAIADLFLTTTELDIHSKRRQPPNG
jgi:hypothetical protein